VISGWLVKVLVGIALIGFAVIELGSPLIARAQADDAAHAVADDVAFHLRDPGQFTEGALKQACADEAAKHTVTIVVCRYDGTTNKVNVTINKHARSFVLDKVSVTKDWYDVKAHASATPK
jgi:SpoU rRNA methylase family enzyme